MARFGAVPREVPRVASLDVLAPAVQRAIPGVLDMVERETGARPVVFETLRTDERQRFLYGFGRDYDDGRGVVTKVRTARGGWHFFGLAVDCIHPDTAWGAPEAWWLALARAYRANGMRSGLDWNDNGTSTDETWVDRPHGQWRRCLVTPSARALDLYRHGGLAAVHRAVGAL